MSDRNRELERKVSVLQQRIKEYEEIFKDKNEDWDKRDKEVKMIKSEYEGLKSTIVSLE